MVDCRLAVCLRGVAGLPFLLFPATPLLPATVLITDPAAAAVLFLLLFFRRLSDDIAVCCCCCSCNGDARVSAPMVASMRSSTFESVSCFTTGWCKDKGSAAEPLLPRFDLLTERLRVRIKPPFFFFFLTDTVVGAAASAGIELVDDDDGDNEVVAAAPECAAREATAVALDNLDLDGRADEEEDEENSSSVSASRPTSSADPP